MRGISKRIEDVRTLSRQIIHRNVVAFVREVSRRDALNRMFHDFGLPRQVKTGRDTTKSR